MNNLVTMVEEAARSTEEGVKNFVEPAHGTLQRSTSRRHHLIFGRRGSGKSSLLRKAAADLTIDRRPIAYINLEPFKGHSYPDVLLSVLIATFREYKKWLDSAAIHPSSRKSFWRALFNSMPSRSPYNKKDTAVLSDRFSKQIDILERELHQPDNVDMRRFGAELIKKQTGVRASAAIKAPVSGITSEVNAEFATEQRKEIEEKFRREKTDFLLRHIMDYQALFKELAKLSGGDSFLILDDLYHIRRSDQAMVIDYFHRIAKDHYLWLKIGTIRHRTNWYIHGDPPIGVKIGDDIDEIALDLTLEKYSIAKQFLLKILNNFSQNAGFQELSDILTDGAMDRLVLASGGVARDFLSIFRRSVNIANERSGGAGESRIGAEDVNVAAGEYDSSKREEFKRDVLEDDELSLDGEFARLRGFCLDQINCNCFLLDKDYGGKEIELIHELVDLKLVHLVRSRVTVSGRPGKIYEAYMLDLSQYAGARKRRNLDIIEFWKGTANERLRRSSLIFEPQR